MLVLILERVPAALRGELTRWLIEPRTGVFVGRVSALVRDRLWEKVSEACGPGSQTGSDAGPGALLLFRARNEQGFSIRSVGHPSRQVVEFEGLRLIRIPKAHAAGSATTRSRKARGARAEPAPETGGNEQLSEEESVRPTTD